MTWLGVGPPAYSAEGKNDWNNTTSAPYAFMTCRENLTLTVWVSKKSIWNFYREMWNSKTTQNINDRTEELYLFSRKVAGSIPDGVTGIFHWQNPSGRTMALELTQHNRNEYQKYFLGDKGGRCVGLTLPPSCADYVEIWEPYIYIYIYIYTHTHTHTLLYSYDNE
jgi:hypothetical protein